MAHRCLCTHCQKPLPCPGWEVVSASLETLLAAIAQINVDLVDLPDPDEVRELMYGVCVEYGVDHQAAAFSCDSRCSAAWWDSPLTLPDGTEPVIPEASRN